MAHNRPIVPPVGAAKTLDSVRGKRRSDSLFAVNVDLTVPERQTLVVLGPSGRSKTIPLMIVSGLAARDEGSVLGGSLGQSQLTADFD